MYVIEATITAGNIAAANLGNGVHYLPADRCNWQQESVPNTSNYRITGVHYGVGNVAPVDLEAAGNSFRLGYVAKTGRFVGMTV